MRKTFLENLPTGNGYGVKSDQINWKNSIGYKVNFIYDDIKNFIEIKNYTTQKHKLTIIYNDNEYQISTDGFKACQFGKLLGKYTSDFKIKIGTKLQDDKRALVIIDREYRSIYEKDGKLKQNDKWYLYHCDKCGYEGWIRESNLKNNGCLCCSGKVLIEGINDIPTTAPWMVKYFQGGIEEAKLYTKYGYGNPNNKEGKIIPICPNCGRVKDKKTYISNIYKNHSIGCSCSDNYSYANKIAFNLLEQLKINFILEYSPDWIKPKAYDFYFERNTKEYILEMDGGWHSKDNNMSGQTAEESIMIDNYKDELAEEHGIEVIRIDCDYYNINNRFEYIKNNILNNKRLNELFDLNSIDWNEINKTIEENFIMLRICELWNKGFSIKDIINEIKIIKSNPTITRYLKQGSKFGWCNYNADEERKKGQLKASKSEGRDKQIICMNDYVVFNNAVNCINYYYDKYNLKLYKSSISNVCNNKQKNTQGLIFKFIKDLTSEEYIKYDIENKLKQNRKDLI